MHRGRQQLGQQSAIQVAPFLPQPELARQRLLDIKAIRCAGIQDQAKAQVDDRASDDAAKSGAGAWCRASLAGCG